MRIGIAGVDATTRTLLHALLSRGDAESVGIASDAPPQAIVRFLTRGWAGDRTRLDGWAEGDQLLLRGRYGRGGLREDWIRVHTHDDIRSGEAAGAYDVWIGADVVAAQQLLEPDGAAGSAPVVGWGPSPHPEIPWIWPWSGEATLAALAGSGVVPLPPPELVGGLAFLSVADGLAEVRDAAILAVVPGHAAGATGDLPGVPAALTVTWDAPSDFLFLKPAAVELRCGVRFALVRAPVVRGGAIVVTSTCARDVDEGALGRRVKRAARDALKRVLAQEDADADSSSAFGVPAIAVLGECSLSVSSTQATCTLATSCEEARSIQAGLVLDQLRPAAGLRTST